MNKTISVLGGKKVLFTVAVVMFLAAACNSKQSAMVMPPADQAMDSAQDQNGDPNQNDASSSTIQSTSHAEIDAAVSGITADIDNEQTVNLQSDEDVLNSDASVINSYKGVVNENSF